MRTSLLAIATIAQLTLLATADPEPYKIPLYRRSSDGITTAAGKALDNGVLAGTIQIGTPPQNFTVAFDTSSGYSWIRGSRCKSENCLDRCTYYSRRSSTSQPTGRKFSVKYGSECVDTEIYLDTVEFAGLKVHDMPFGGAYRMSGFADGFDGYLGLGPSVNFNTSKLTLNHLTKRDTTLPASAFVANAYEQNSGVGSSQFGMYTTDNGAGFNQDGTSTTDTSLPANGTTTTTTTTSSSVVAAAAAYTTTASVSTTTTTEVTSGGFGFVKRQVTQDASSPAGYLVIGGIDNSVIQGNMTYLPLSDTSSQSWTICVKHAKIGHPLPLPQQPDTTATITTSNPYILMPPHQAHHFQKTYAGKLESGTYRIKCSEIKWLPPLELTFDHGITVQLPANYWTQEIDRTQDRCQALVGPSTSDWILGAPFTNAFYTSFDTDNAQVGLAIKKGNTNKDLQIYHA